MKNKYKEFISEHKTSIIFTCIVLVLVSFFHIFEDKNDISIYKDMKIKTNYAEGSMKLLVYSSPELVANHIAFQGTSKLSDDSIVIGYDEAMMMKEEKLFSKTGELLQGFFGIDTKVGGILEKTGTPLDMMHFLSEKQYSFAKGDDSLVFIKIKDGKEPKLFYSYYLDEENDLILKLSEGNINDYRMTKINGKEYYPLIIGYDEAIMMKKEKLFSKTGDTLEGFFGKDVIIIGIAEKTGSPLDMMHLMPLNSEDIKE